MTIEPKYKNSKTSNNLTLTFEVSAVGHRMNEKEFTLETFKNIDVNAMLSEVGIPKDKKTSFTLSVYSDEKEVKRFYLKVNK